MQTTCLAPPDLARYLDGQISVSEEEAISSHVDQCASCQETLRDMRLQDTFVQRMRNLGEPDAFEQEPSLQAGLKSIHEQVGSENGAPRRPPSRLAMELPEQVGPYTIHARLASGGMGAVFRATHTHLKRVVALKILPADRWIDPAAVDRFQREMEAIGRLNHPHIIRATDAGFADGLHYLAMDYVLGVHWGRLARVLGPLPVRETAELLRQAALGLEYVHQHGLVHRDIKPSNLMLAWQDELDGSRPPQRAVTKILDLGLARLTEEPLPDERELTTIGQLMGTLDYMSPEQGWDSHAVDARSDIYSLGATAFRLLTGRAPYAGPGQDNLLRKVRAMATEPPPAVCSMRTDLPGEFAAVIDRMLAVDLSRRYQTAAEVASAMQLFADGADLDALLRQAESADDVAAESASDAGLPVNLFRTRTNKQNSSVAPIEKTAPTVAPGRGYSRWWTIVSTALASFALLGVIYLATDYGELVIRTDDPNITVAIKRSDQVVKQWQLEQGNNQTRIRSGEYVIELTGVDGDLLVKPDRVVLTRGEREIVTVERRASKRSRAAAGTDGSDMDGMILERRAEGPQVEGWNYDIWYEQIQQEVNESRLARGIFALHELTTPANEQRTASAIMQVMRRYGSDVIDSNVDRGELILGCIHAAWGLSVETLEQTIGRELTEGNRQSRDFLVAMLQYGYENFDAYTRQEVEAKAELLKSRLRLISNRLVHRAQSWLHNHPEETASVARLIAALIAYVPLDLKDTDAEAQLVLSSGDTRAILTLSKTWGKDATDERIRALLSVVQSGKSPQRDAALAQLMLFPQPLPQFALTELQALVRDQSIPMSYEYQTYMQILGAPIDEWKSGSEIDPRSDRETATSSAGVVISPGSRIKVQVAGALPESPIDGDYLVEPSGHVPLGPEYGRAYVAGMTFEEAERTITKKLAEVLQSPRVLVTLPDDGTVPGFQQQVPLRVQDPSQPEEPRLDTQQLAGCELHVVGLYMPEDHQTDDRVYVKVLPAEKPMVIALTSYFGANWQIKLEPGAVVKQVIISSSVDKSLVQGLPQSVPVLQISGTWAYALQTHQGRKLVASLQDLTALPLSTFQGQYQGKEMVVDGKLGHVGEAEIRATRPNDVSEFGAAIDPAALQGCKLHVVGISGPESMTDDRVTVEVQKTEDPIVLVLTAYSNVYWQVKFAEGAVVKQVIVGGYYEPAIDGVPDSVPVSIRSYFPHPNREYFYAYAWHTSEGRNLVKRLKELTHLDVATFQGYQKAQSIVVDGQRGLIPNE